MFNRFRHATIATILTLAAIVLLAAAGCGSPESTVRTIHTQKPILSVPTTTAPAPPAERAPAGISLDPSLRSATGTPSPDEMAALIALQKKVPYPIIVPAWVPDGMKLDTSLMDSGSVAGDPAGFYSYKYAEPGSNTFTLTFNQTSSNSQPLADYYLTEENVEGVDYQVYWHRDRDYLPENGQPVRTTKIVKPESFVVVWQGQFKDAAGQTHDLYYSMTTGIWTGWDWGTIRDILASLKPLSDVGS